MTGTEANRKSSRCCLEISENFTALWFSPLRLQLLFASSLGMHTSRSSFLFSFSLSGILSQILVICITLFFTFVNNHLAVRMYQADGFLSLLCGVRCIFIITPCSTTNVETLPHWSSSHTNTHYKALSLSVCILHTRMHTHTHTHTAIELQQCQIDHPAGCPPACSLFYYPITAAVW